jgi:cell division protein FtsL
MITEIFKILYLSLAVVVISILILFASLYLNT